MYVYIYVYMYVCLSQIYPAYRATLQSWKCRKRKKALPVTSTFFDLLLIQELLDESCTSFFASINQLYRLGLDHTCSSLNCWWFYAPMLLITFNNMANFSWLDFDKSVRAAVINQRFRWAGICRFLLLKKSNFTRKNWGCRVFCTNKFCSWHYYCKQEMLLHARNHNFCRWRFSWQKENNSHRIK